MKLDGLWFRHYKGTEYQVVCEAEDSEDLTPQIVYRDRKGRTWVRSKWGMVGFMSSVTNGDRRFAPMTYEAAPAALNTCELRRQEAVVVIQVYEGDLVTTEHRLALERGRLEVAPEGGTFKLNIISGTHGDFPDGFFGGEFDLKYSSQLGELLTLKGCEVNNPQPRIFSLAGTFKSLSHT